MNTSISQNIVIGTVIASLSLIYVATMPLSVQAATKDKKVVNLTCMQTAIDTREEAVIKAFDKFNDSMSEALSDRKDALHDAWGISDKADRNQAVRTAWTDWKKAKKEVHTELRADRKTAWINFNKTAKTTCKETLPKEESIEKDSSGAISL